MGSVIQKYKKLISKVEDLELNKSHALIDLELSVDSRKRLKKNRSILISKNHLGAANYSKKDIDELERMISKKSIEINTYLQQVKMLKREIAKTNQKLSNLV